MVSMSYSLWRGELGIRWQGQGQGQDFPPHHNFGVEEMMTMIKIVCGSCKGWMRTMRIPFNPLSSFCALMGRTRWHILPDGRMNN